MKIGLTERQYNRIISKTTENQEIKEDGETSAAEPEAGTSAQQSGGQGYPAVGKWESGVTRGPANQIGVTKWSDVVGATLKRDRGNQLKETHYTKKEFLLLIEQTMPFYDKTGKFFMGGPMNKPQGAIDANDLFPNIKDGKYPTTVDPKIIQSYLSYNGFSQFNPDNKNRLAVGNIFRSNNPQISPELSKYFAKSSPNYWKGKPQPQKPTPFNGQILSSTGTKLPEQPWGYYEGKLGNLETQMSQYESDFTNWLKANDINQYYNVVRKSPKGKDVPKGYSPLEYDEYRSKIDPIVKQIESLTKPKPSARGWKDTGTIPLTKEEQNKLDNLRLQRDNINKEYYNEDFPNGISKEQKKQLDLWKNALNQYYKPLIEKEKESAEKSQQSNSKIDKTYVYRPKMVDGIYSMSMEYNKKLTDLKKVFGYNHDNRSGFDKFWDEWGTVIQIGGGLILTVLIPELGIPLLTMRSMMIADTVFNLAIAAYQTSRDQTENAAGSVIFAILPHLNIFKVPSAIAESISKKVAVAPLKTSSDLAIFMKTMLNEEEAKWLTTILKSDKKTLENATKEITKRFIKTQESLGVKASTKQIQKLETSWLNKGVNKFKKIDPLARTAPKILEKPIIKKIGFDLGVYFTVTEWINAIEEKAKIKLEEKERKNLEAYFNSVPEEVKEIFTNLSLSQIEKIGDGNINEALDEMTKEETQINPETNKPFTNEEWDKVKEDIRNDFPDEKSKLSDEVVNDLEK